MSNDELRLVDPGFRDSMRQDMTEDSWANLVSGLGTMRDKSAHTAWSPEIQLHLLELTDLFNFDSIVQRIATAVPEETFREGYTVHATSPEKTAKLRRESQLRAIDQVFQEADTWARLYGGAIVCLNPADGRAPTEPLDIHAIRSVGRLEIFDRRYVWPWSYYETDSVPDLLRPKVYNIAPLGGTARQVHESRVIIFRGALTDANTRIRNNSWDLSVLDAPIEAVKAFWEAFGSARSMLSEASVGVLKLRGLLAMLAGPNKSVIEARMSLLDMGKSLIRALVLEAGDGNSAPESFERVAMQMAGTPELLDRFANVLSASTGIPVTRLMGQAPAGLSATGEADMRMWFDKCRSYQNRTVKPKLERLYDLMCRAEGWRGEAVKIEFNKLWQESPKEEADRRKTVAETDALYLTNMVVSPERVAANRFGPVYSAEMSEPEPTGEAPAAADLAAYKEALAKAPAPPAPTPPAAPGASER